MKHISESNHKSNDNMSTQSVELLNTNRTFKCKVCEYRASKKRDLTLHMKDVHKSFKPCNQFLNDKCEFDSDCMYNHVNLRENEVICFTCGNKFQDKHSLLTHIRNIHGNAPCKNFLKGNCKFNERCFFRHYREVNNTPSFLSTPISHTTPPGSPQDMELSLQNIMTNILKQMKPLILQEIGNHMMMVN